MSGRKDAEDVAAGDTAGHVESTPVPTPTTDTDNDNNTTGTK